MTFNIASQSGGIINNVQGDQRITGGQHGNLVTASEARDAMHSLRGALAAAALDQTSKVQAHNEIATMDAAMDIVPPDRSRFADALGRLTQLLATAGSLATAGGALIGSLQTLAAWLGDMGQPILHLLAAQG
jgi:hypothetical protein